MTKTFRAFLAVVILAAVAAGLWVLYTYDPVQTAFFPKCIIRSFTGLQCPGCGLQRALHALLHGEIAASFTYNPFIYFTSLILVSIWLFPRMTGHPFFGYAVALLVVAYTVIRNVMPR